MKVMIFGPAGSAGCLVLPAAASEVRVDRLVRCETNASCSPETGIVTGPPVRPWDTVLSFIPAADLSGKDLEEVRAAAGAAAAVAVTATDLLPAPANASFPVKTLGVLRKRPADTRERFAEHWLTRHARVTLGYCPAFGRYVANTVDAVAGEFRWDGVVEQYFASLDELAEHVRLARDGRRPEITADIPRFLSHMVVFAATPAEAALSS